MTHHHHHHPLPCSKRETEGLFLLSTHPPPLPCSKRETEGVVSPPPPYSLPHSKCETRETVFFHHLPTPSAQNARWRGLSLPHSLPHLTRETEGDVRLPPVTTTPYSLPRLKRETEGGCLSTTTLLPPSLETRDGGSCLPSTTSILPPSLETRDGCYSTTLSPPSLETRDGGGLSLHHPTPSLAPNARQRGLFIVPIYLLIVDLVVKLSSVLIEHVLVNGFNFACDIKLVTLKFLLVHHN